MPTSMPTVPNRPGGGWGGGDRFDATFWGFGGGERVKKQTRAATGKGQETSCREG